MTAMNLMWFEPAMLIKADAAAIGDWIRRWCEQNQTFEPDFWMTWWKILYAPEIAIPLMVLLILLLFIAPYIGWKIKGGIDNARIKDMEAQIDAANNRLLLTKEQRAAGADVESGLQMLRKRLAELDMRFKAGAKQDELATRLDIVAQTVAKLTSVNDVLQRTFVQTEATKKAG